MQIAIREGKYQDLAAIRKLVLELAIYEKEPDAVTASLEEYQQSFTDGDFEFIVAESEESIVGLALYYMTFSTWKGKMLYLEDFVVTASQRRSGTGQKLWDKLLDIAINKNCTLLKWQVLEWNEPALKFYIKNDAIIEKDWWNGKIILKPEKY